MTDTRTSIATGAPPEDRVVASDRTDDQAPPGVAARSGEAARSTETARPVGERAERVIRIPDVPVRRMVALALIGAGGLVILFLVYLFAFTPLTAARNQQRLAQSVISQPVFRYGLATGQVPAEGSAVAVLSIPALHLHQVVVEGTSSGDLMNGPGLMPGTALPGTPGNAVIAGKRVTFGAPFGSLGQLRSGDRVHVVDGAGSFTYRVTRTLVVTAGQHDVVTPTADNRLTLITSNSTLSPSGRLVVLAKLVGSPYAVPANVVAVPTYELGLGGDPSAGGLALMWSLISVLVLILAGLAVWRWRRPWLVYIFATPVFIACGLFACESVARALPATF